MYNLVYCEFLCLQIKFLLPKSALGLRELRPPQWVSLVQAAWTAAAPLAPYQVKAQVLHVLSTWPLFGSSFFAVKRAWSPDGLPAPGDDMQEPWRELILALNRRGVLFLEPNTHETLQHWPFSDVISTRKVCYINNDNTRIVYLKKILYLLKLLPLCIINICDIL